MLSQNSKNGFTVKAFRGDAKTMLAFNITKQQSKNLAGFTIQCKPENIQPYYLLNELHFEKTTGYAQNKLEPQSSTLNSPIQSFRWVHVPGNYHQQGTPFYGNYTYTVTPRYFDGKGLLKAIDNSLAVDVVILVQPFTKGSIQISFTRGFVQSQAFVHHFGKDALLKPKKYDLTFDTNQQAGKNSTGKEYSFADEYEWSGFTARNTIFEFLNEVKNNPNFSINVMAYDLNEPDIVQIFLDLAKEGRIKIILDNASLHHNSKNLKPEDIFEEAFIKALPGNSNSEDYIIRGHFNRFQHNKVFILKKENATLKVLTGSTNFSITGLYVNSNHVIVVNDSGIADKYAQSFNEAWNGHLNNRSFAGSETATQTFEFSGNGLPDMNITFSPHNDSFSLKRLTDISARVNKEKSSVLFAVMDTDETVKGPISKTLIDLHKNQKIFSYGISDSKSDIFLYKPGTGSGIKVTGLPGTTLLPPPFDKEKSISLGHQIHHKFIVCGFNTDEAVVWCGSSNLAQGGEDNNGDNLIEINDRDIATVFAIEAFILVDHFLFRNKFIIKKTKAGPGSIYLFDNDEWAKKYFDPKDLYYQERILF